MRTPTAGFETRDSPSRDAPPSVGGSLATLLSFLLVASAAMAALTHPFAVAAALAGVVAVALVVRTVLRLAVRRRGTLRRVDVPGLGTVEYRVLRP